MSCPAPTRGIEAAVALLVVLGSASCHEAVSGPRPPILLITLDTTRLDRLGCYGYARNTSAALDRLAADSVVYDRAFSPATWTLPAHASLFTGKFVSSHGAHLDPHGPLVLTQAIAGPAAWDQYRARGLGAQEETLADILRRAGYATAAVVAGPWLKRVFGLDKGFERYDDGDIDTLNGRSAHSVTDAALAVLEQERDEPLFLFLNYFDPHAPPQPPERFARAFAPDGDPGRESGVERLDALYDAEILYMDSEIGRLFAGLRRLELYDDTWIIVAADHGELLGEHREFGHGDTPYQEVLHVPLIVKYPQSSRSGRSDALFELVDVLPMILAKLKLPVPPGVQGTSPPRAGQPVFAESYPLPISSPHGAWRVLIDGSMKYVWNSHDHKMLFDLKADPEEATNLFATHRAQAAAMERRLDQFAAALPRPGSAAPVRAVDEETREALRGLGYIDR
jgi:arylsulfatase A-like enzyme